MFERFADRARRIVVLAQEESRRLDHQHIGTEHLLLGLLAQNEGLAAQALESLEITLEAVRQQVAEIVGPGRHAPSAHMPFSRRAKKVLENSQRETLRLRHSEIDTAHVLLGLLGEDKGVGAQVLVKLGVDLDQVRLRVLQLLLPGPLTQSDHTDEAGDEKVVSPSNADTTARLEHLESTLAELGKRLAALEERLNRD